MDRANAPSGIITRTLDAVLTRAEDGSRRLRAIASTSTEDRAGDIVDQGSWRLDRYRANPVILRQHDHATPIARADHVGVTGGRLMVDIGFPKAGAAVASDEAWNLVEAGILRALSVGFRPGRREALNNSRGGFRLFDCELFEISLVSVPANPDCLVIGAGQTGAKADEAAAARLRVAEARIRVAGLDTAAGRIAQARHAQEIADRAMIRKFGTGY